MYPHSKHKCSHKYIDEHSPCRVLGSSVSHLFHRGGGQTLKQKILQAFYSNHLKAMVKRKCSQTINSEWATWRTPSPSDRCIPKSVQEWNHGPLSDVRIKEHLPLDKGAGTLPHLASRRGGQGLDPLPSRQPWLPTVPGQGLRCSSAV